MYQPSHGRFVVIEGVIDALAGSSSSEEQAVAGQMERYSRPREGDA